MGYYFLMQYRITRLRGIFLLLILFFLILTPISGYSSTPTTKQMNDIVKIAVDKTIPPYCYIDENGELKGFNIDLLNAIEQHTNLTFEYVPVNWENALTMLKNKEVDAVMATVPTPERNKTFDFTKVYQYLSFNFFQRANMPQITKIDDIENHTLAVIKNDITEIFAYKWMNETNKKIYLVYVDTPQEALELINSNSVDLFLYEIHTASYIITKLSLKNVKITDIEAFSMPLAIAVRKGMSWLVNVLNNAIDAVKTSGEYTAIYDKWFNPSISPIPWYFYYALAAFIISLVVIGIIGFKYKKSEERIKEQRRRIMNLVALSQTLMEKMPIGILYVRDGQCLYANPEALKIFRYNFEDLNKYKIFKPLLTGKEEVSIKTKDGKLKWLYVKSIEYKGGKIISIIDITERKNLETMERERFEYLNNMLDALRNPMQNILLASEDIENEEMQKIIKKEVDKIIDILREEPK